MVLTHPSNVNNDSAICLAVSNFIVVESGVSGESNWRSLNNDSDDGDELVHKSDENTESINGVVVSTVDIGSGSVGMCCVCYVNEMKCNDRVL